MLPPSIEDLLRTLPAGGTAHATLRVRVLGRLAPCRLTLTLDGVEAPPEATARLDLFDFNAPLTGAAGGVSHGQQRLAFVEGIVRGWGVQSLADVGCGEAKLLRRLVATRAPIGTLVGVDATPTDA
eukprot:1928718-Prymnesium_polylepis.1